MIVIPEDQKTTIVGRQSFDTSAPSSSSPPTYGEALVNGASPYNAVPGPSAPPSPQPASVTPSTSRSKSAWKDALDVMQVALLMHGRARERGDAVAAAQSEAAVLRSMQTVGETHPDARVRKSWRARALKLAAARPGEKETVFHDAARGMIALVVLPLAVSGWLIYVSGSLIIGTGKVLTGLGKGLAGGRFDKPKSRYQPQRETVPVEPTIALTSH